MANIPGQGSSDPLYGSVGFIYSLRADYVDKGPVGLSDATLNGSGSLDNTFDWGGGAGAPGTGAYFPNGEGNYVSLPSGSMGDLGTGDWTLDLWCYGLFNRLSSITSGIFKSHANIGTTNTVHIQSTGSGDRIQASLNSNDGSFFTLTGTTDLDNNVPYFVSLCRNGNTLFLYVLGNLEATQDVTGKIFNFSGNNLVRGLANDGSTSSLFGGYIADIRWTNAARYDGTNFTAEALPLATQLAASASSRNRRLLQNIISG